ncbi:exonuclease SbcCD subunit D [Microbacterium sp. zg.Y1090]|uniref:exonuclease SbcCD subunit D n=1 Tax=Microbacterium TaxID=33882 RepID=UPI00214C25B4|nr:MULTISPECIES: exonuclease SbcCD subunit D [unclassified Microbacterium]MCR2812497.1 exonuclease SbcCD subunit D [Microbacterium sp. zg.Y1084]MCR2817702.1 exonuclease SbcCD subunit D [Microbacterium sp. zg.Y1090]MDL5485655.1 exonuclease SbcCD subunit D [Microbacterium sp. zg-Y1211]WIM28826.1 exonuclease SbcCD subunit D [Microbacterium sp. zg-Y1090]
MRILHTSDWHIGRTFHGHATLDALRVVLDAMVTQVRQNDVDVVIVAGDVFDSATPAAACYALLTDTLVALADAGAQVVVTSGNHDSAARLGFQSALLREGIHVVTDPQTAGTPLTFTDAHGAVHVYALPFLEPALLRHVWPGVRSQADVMTHAMHLVRTDLAERGGRSVAVAHCFAAGVEPTPHLERDIQQGGLDVVPLSAFDGVDYMALGHIHGRQRLSDAVRYAGAPLHYSFGEGDKPRGSWLVELGAAGLTEVTWLELPVPRRLVTLTGPLDELLADERFAVHEDAWVSVEYTDPLPQRDPMRRLQQRFAHCACVAHRPAETMPDDGRSYSQRVRAARSDRELLDVFLRHVREGEGANDRESALIDDLLDDRTLAEAAT